MPIDFRKLNKVSIIAGYKNFFDFFIKFAVPILSIVSLIAIFAYTFIEAVPGYLALIFVGLGAVMVFAYPYAQYGSRRRSINNHLHLFITYAGTLSTMRVSRNELFKKISQKKIFGDISKLFKKINYLAKSWNLGYAEACRVMVPNISSEIMADFIDRLAVIMDFGESLETFLYDEQKSVLDDYEVDYKKSFETIEMLQELFVAASVSFAFLLGIGLLAPLLLEIPLTTVLFYGLIGLIVFDVGIGLAIYTFLPKDSLFHELDDKSREQKHLRNIFWGTFSLCVLIAIFIYIYTDLDLLYVLAISLSPMIYPGFVANRLEDKIIKRDKQFPVYARVLGSAIEVRNGGIVSALKSTQTHDFGVLEEMSISLYRRLRLGSDKFKSWYLFAVESSSNLISNFVKIFSESIYLGGNAEEVGEIISDNMQRLISLRKYRLQLVGSVRGAFYGSMIGLIATVFVSSKISELLIDVFNQPNLSSDVTGLIDNILPQAANVSFEGVMFYITLIIVVQALSASWIMKGIDGGTPYAAVLDFLIMLWIGAALAYVLPEAVESLLPDLEGMFNEIGNNTADVETGLN